MTSTDTKSSLACAAFEDTWSHQRRKRRTAQRELIKKHNETLCNGHLTTSESSFEETSPKRSKKDVEGSQDVDKIEIKESPVTQNDTRIESSASQTQVGTSQAFPLLECTVTLKSIGQSIVLEILRTGGSSGRDTVHQVLQYFKNKLK